MKTLATLLIIINISLMFFGCSDDNIVKTYNLNRYNSDEIRVLSTEGVKNIKITNGKGGSIVTGWSQDSTMRIYLYKTIDASSSDLAEIHFDDMTNNLTIIDDTLNLETIFPKDTDEIEYNYCSLSIEIPYNMNCNIQDINGPIIISQLNSDLLVEGNDNNVEIKTHEGSVIVNSNQEIKVQMSLADDGYCKLNSSDGNVYLSIPDSTNSSVNLITETGAITFSELTFNPITIDTKSLSGHLGSGSAEISIYSKNGNIQLTGF